MQPVVAGLINAFKDAKYPQGRQAALLATARMGVKAKAAIPILIAIVKSREYSQDLRMLAADALCSMGKEGKPTLEPLIEFLRDANQPEALPRLCGSQSWTSRLGC